MITCLRDVRRARRLTLQDVADRCDPPTTAQTISRLETGTRTVSVAWLNRIAAALGVAAADLVTLPQSAGLPLVGILTADGMIAPRRPEILPVPRPAPGQVAIRIMAGTGDYRGGDELWCDRLAPDGFATAMNRDVLAPGAAGRLHFGRLMAITADGLRLLPLAAGIRPQTIPSPPWLALPVSLVRPLR